MNWLIIEDALKDRYGHWLEFVSTFQHGLLELGDQLIILGPNDASEDVLSETGMEPVLPNSKWRMEKLDQHSFRKAIALLAWLFRSIVVIRSRIRQSGHDDVIFVPTVGIPHLVVWFVLLKFLPPKHGVVLLYFMASPVGLHQSTGEVVTQGISGKLFSMLLRGLRHQSRTGTLVLAAETDALSGALAKVSDAQFHTLPQPVNKMYEGEPAQGDLNHILLASYGLARFEKGSDILIAAIEAYLLSNKRSDVKFAIQWLEDFDTPDGRRISIPPSLQADPRFIHIDYLFGPGEYATWLAKTSLMVLPYRNVYALRGSRVVIEAIIHGIPVVVSRHTTLQEHGEQFGAALCCEGSSVVDLTVTINDSIQRITSLRSLACNLAGSAGEYFSVRGFRRRLLDIQANAKSQNGSIAVSKKAN